MDDSNQPATGQRGSVGQFNFAECFLKAFHASPYVQTVTRFDSGRYLYVNDGFVKAVGYEREEVIGKTSLELGLMVDQPDRTWLTQMLAQHGRVTCKKLRFRLRSGDVRIGLFNAEVIHLDGENLILSSVSDITEQLAAEHRYHLQSQRVALVQELAAALAHEVRNPLAGIKGVADAFLNRRKLTAQEREWMEAVRGEVLKIDARLRELQDLTRPRVVNIQTCSLSKLIKRIVLLAKHHTNVLPDRDVTIDFVDEIGEPLEMPLDPAQIEDAVLNLLLNAIESIDDSGRVTVRLSVRKNTAGDEAVITVCDTGCGISEADRKCIFDPFFTTKPEGTGVGLSAVQRTAETFNGRISFETCAGRGSTFELSLLLPPTELDSHEH
ncbi:MAG TPA: ATP-binding protein [Pyrinomonadaceae bacterium]|nr:ATP-binding protein [Pyrinomonadaceae bacterium]